MSGSKHPRPERPSDKDLKENPGIGTSKGLDRANADFEEIEGENTVEGDVDNDTTRSGGINPVERRRTNK